MNKQHKSTEQKQVKQKNSKSGEGMKVYKRLLRYALPYAGLFLIGLLGTVMGSSVDAGLVWALKPLLDQGFIARNQQFIDLLPYAVVIAFVLRGTAGFINGYFINRVGRSVVKDFRQEIFAKMLCLPAKFYDKHTSGQMISTLLYNVDQLAGAGANTLVTVVRETCLILGLLVVMFVTSWKLTFLFFITVPFIAFIAKFSSKRMRGYSHRIQTGMGDITHIAEEAVEGYKVIRTFGGQAYENAKFAHATVRNFKREVKLITTNSLASPLVQLTISFVIAITMYLATTSVGQITAGGFASILAAMLAILRPLKSITNVNNIIQKGIAAAESIFELLDETPEKDTGTQNLQRAKGTVSFKHINFAYADNKSVLHDINFTVQPGETVALVGKSGSGKSTLVNLLPRFYDDYSGQISVDGIDIRDLKLADLRHQFAFVSQHVTLFNDTLERNIAYGNFSHIDQAEIQRAAESANAWEFIAKLPEGLETMIGENGLLLSGGQRQRIAIARAILKDAPILILDEATSSLDSESELHIQHALQDLMQDRTTLVIAHRLSTIENADKIMVLDEGRIVEIGTHKELLALGGHYARLHHMQFKEEKPHVKEEMAVVEM